MLILQQELFELLRLNLLSAGHALTTMAALPHGATPRPGDPGCNELSGGKEPSWGCQGSSALQLRCVPGGAADLPQDI